MGRVPPSPTTSSQSDAWRGEQPACSPLDRNLTATGCLSLSLPVPLRELRLDKSAVLSLPVPHCPSLSVKENDYEQRRSQVRVLPSVPKKALQIVEFCNCLPGQ